MQEKPKQPTVTKILQFFNQITVQANVGFIYNGPVMTTVGLLFPKACTLKSFYKLGGEHNEAGRYQPIFFFLLKNILRKISVMTSQSETLIKY